jgi:AraC family transcriptional regulator
MPEFNVEIVELDRMRVACSHAYGEAPELHALEQLLSWAEPWGLLEDHDLFPVFGFNYPPPSSDHREYGYECWIRIRPEDQPAGTIKIKEFTGGLFAMTKSALRGEVNITEGWTFLWAWVRSSEYQWRQAPFLERFLNPTAPMVELEFELYLPVTAPGAAP